LKTIRWFFNSNILLAVIAIQVFVQVWIQVVDAPIIGMFLSLWLSLKLGSLAGYADILQVRLDAEREFAGHLIEYQQEFDALPADERLALAEAHAEFMQHLAPLHQMLIEHCQIPYTPLKFRDMLPSPTKWLARRRERKIMATDKVVHV
jgi:hypothetical protein